VGERRNNPSASPYPSSLLTLEAINQPRESIGLTVRRHFSKFGDNGVQSPQIDPESAPPLTALRFFALIAVDLQCTCEAEPGPAKCSNQAGGRSVHFHTFSTDLTPRRLVAGD
jgi:hypothetical protein